MSAAVDTLGRTTCGRCATPYRAHLVNGCPVCGMDEQGIDHEARERRLLAMVVGATASNLILLAFLVVAIN